jgi:enterochelin esterase-like enzyme
VLEPQGTLFFLLLMLAFGGLVVWLALTRQVVFRVLAACLAFIPAMTFGIAAVNKYYDYYQTWDALFSDLSGQGVQSVPQVTAAGVQGSSVSAAISMSSSTSVDAQTGYLFRTVVTGPSSRITREVYVYLPPQYFSKAYVHYRFPAIELLHGAPGEPQTWVNVMNVIPIYLQLMAAHQAAPAVLVMPDTDGGLRYSLQCLNDPHGQKDLTFVGREVPAWVAANLRVQRPGLLWGIAGYSEGGFCAANIGLRDASRFGYDGVLSGYFAPDKSQVPAGGKPGGRPRDVNVFAHDPRLALVNTPDKYVLKIPIGIEVPQFWLAAGAEDKADVQGAAFFRQLLLTRVADVPLMVVPGGGHQARVWRAALRPMLAWMTTQLAAEAQRFTVAKPAARPSARPSRTGSAAHVPGLSTRTLPKGQPEVAWISRRIGRLSSHRVGADVSREGLEWNHDMASHQAGA